MLETAFFGRRVSNTPLLNASRLSGMLFDDRATVGHMRAISSCSHLSLTTGCLSPHSEGANFRDCKKALSVARGALAQKCGEVEYD